MVGLPWKKTAIIRLVACVGAHTFSPFAADGLVGAAQAYQDDLDGEHFSRWPCTTIDNIRLRLCEVREYGLKWCKHERFALTEDKLRICFHHYQASRFASMEVCERVRGGHPFQFRLFHFAGPNLFT